MGRLNIIGSPLVTYGSPGVPLTFHNLTICEKKHDGHKEFTDGRLKIIPEYRCGYKVNSCKTR